MADDDVPQVRRPGWVPVVVGMLDIVKAAMWPAIVLVIFLALHAPLQAMLSELPEVLGRADVITLGELNIKLNKALDFQAPADVKVALNGIRGDAAARLIQLASGIYVMCAQDQNYAENKAADHDLQARLLVQVKDNPPQNDPANKAGCYDAQATDLGNRSRNFLKNLLVTTLNRGSG